MLQNIFILKKLLLFSIKIIYQPLLPHIKSVVKACTARDSFKTLTKSTGSMQGTFGTSCFSKCGSALYNNNWHLQQDQAFSILPHCTQEVL